MPGTKLLGTIAVALFAVGPPAAAQVVRDGSLGIGTISAGLDSDGLPANYVITEKHGEFAAGNLFHSLSEFSVGTGEVASFTLSSDCAGCSVDNIIAGIMRRRTSARRTGPSAARSSGCGCRSASSVRAP